MHLSNFATEEARASSPLFCSTCTDAGGIAIVWLVLYAHFSPDFLSVEVQRHCARFLVVGSCYMSPNTESCSWATQYLPECLWLSTPQPKLPLSCRSEAKKVALASLQWRAAN